MFDPAADHRGHDAAAKRLSASAWRWALAPVRRWPVFAVVGAVALLTTCLVTPLALGVVMYSGERHALHEGEALLGSPTLALLVAITWPERLAWLVYFVVAPCALIVTMWALGGALICVARALVLLLRRGRSSGG